MPDAPALTRDYRRFLNSLKILRGLDQHELLEAGVLDEDDHFGWILARDHPETFFRELYIRDEVLAGVMWRLVNSRQSADLREVT